LMLYGVFRILVEFVRLPDAQLGYFFGTWGTMGQLLSLPMVVAGACLLIWSLARKKPQMGIAEHGHE
ncbi:MAG: prolipoprotein diacylglyceryl transferase family protein, partial [Coriobacteriales bacterium]